VSFAAITLCVASQRVFIFVSVYFVIDSVQKLLDTPSYLYTISHNVIFYLSVCLWLWELSTAVLGRFT
jgi:hypothetical protein